MDPATLDIIMRLVHTGGQGALIVLVWVGSKIAGRAHDAHQTLQRIEQALIADRATNAAAHSSSNENLESLHTDLMSLPLQLARHRRINE